MPRCNDPAGPGQYRGGCGVEKGGILTDVNQTVMSYCCDRSRSITWGIMGGLPSIAQGAILNPNKESEEFLGPIFSNIELKKGDTFTRPSAGGGGLGDPLARDVKVVLEDVIDEYVSIERAKLDYGVVIHEIDRDLDAYEIDMAATVKERDYIRKNRHRWLETDPIEVEQMYNKGEINQMDVVRRYGVIMDYQTNKALPISTEQYREAMKKRSLAYWG